MTRGSEAVLDSQVIDGLRPAIDFFQIVFKLLGPSECFGVTGFLQNWSVLADFVRFLVSKWLDHTKLTSHFRRLMRVIGLPLICVLLIGAMYLFNRWRHGMAHVHASTHATDHGFFAVFYCYPVCTHPCVLR
jgi:hypothetical protein